MIFLYNLNKAKSLHITGRSREIIFINTYIENQYVYLEFQFLRLTYFSEQTTTKYPKWTCLPIKSLRIVFC